MAAARSRQRKTSEYGEQLQEKQKARHAYGLSESQFSKYYKMAAKDRSQTGSTLLRHLETRLDNVIFRAGLSLSRAHARQLVSHKHFKLNGRRVSIPSIAVKAGDVIEPAKPSKIEFNKERLSANWLKVDKKPLKVTITELPAEADLPIEYDTQKIVEYYSR